MSERFFKVLTWAELFALPGFVPEPVQKAQMLNGRLAGEYHMSENEDMRPCGIAKCETPHRHGWVVELVDARLSHVGQVCGRKNFSNWKTMRRNYGAAKRVAAVRDAIALAKESLEAYISSLDYMSMVEERHLQLLKAFDSAPAGLRQIIESRAQSNDNAVMDFRLQTPGEVFANPANQGKSKPIPRRIPYVKGVIAGLPGLSRGIRLDHLVIRRIPEAIERARSLLDAQASASECSDAEKSIKGLVNQIGVSARHLDNFFQPENLSLIPALQQAKSIGLTSLTLEKGDRPTLRTNLGA